MRWVAVRHGGDHIHVVATLARLDGTTPRTWNDFYRVRDACQAAEERFGLQATPPADRTAARRPGRAEAERAARRGWPEPPRTTLRRQVCAAAAGAHTEQEFFARLTEAGVLVRPRFSTIRPGEVTGYAVGLPGHTAKSGGTVWYGGGKLAADLTLPKLRRRWDGAERSAGQGLSGPAARAVLRSTVTEAAERAGSEAEFFASLRAAGIEVRLRFSQVFAGHVTGYAVTLPGHHDRHGQPAWYSGGRLADSLTLPRLRHQWEAAESEGAGRSRAPSGRSGTPRFTTQERDAIYGHAAEQAARAAEHIKVSAARDPAAAADAAWAAADALTVAAQVTGNRELRRAADAYDRAGRAAYGRIPSPAADGQRLRVAARAMALAGRLSGDTSLVTVALIANLAALAAAVAELRQAQHHAAQHTVAGQVDRDTARRVPGGRRQPPRRRRSRAHRRRRSRGPPGGCQLVRRKLAHDLAVGGLFPIGQLRWRAGRLGADEGCAGAVRDHLGLSPGGDLGGSADVAGVGVGQYHPAQLRGPVPHAADRFGDQRRAAGKAGIDERRPAGVVPQVGVPGRESARRTGTAQAERRPRGKR